MAYIYIRLDITSPQHLDRLLFAFVLCFLRGEMLISPRPPRARHAHRAHRSAARYMLNYKQQKAVRAVVEFDYDRSDLSSNLMQVDTFV